MKKILFFITIILFLTVLWIPLAQMKFEFLPKKDLFGVVTTSKLSELNNESWFEGIFQENITNWFQDNFGLRTYLIKTENQFNWQVFNELSSKTNTRIIRGLENYLYEYAYIDEYSRRPQKDSKKLELEVQMLKTLQNKLEKHDIEFLFVISPSKASVYPEFIPNNYIFQDRQVLSRSYDMVTKYLDEYGVNYIDGHKILKDIKEEGDYEVFTKGGVHWNYYGACKVVERIVGRLEGLLNKDMNHVMCDPVIVDMDAHGTDRDLVELINIWTDEEVSGPTPHPKLDIEKSNNNFIPDILFVGDSFTHTLLQVMDGRIYNYRELLYYFKRRIIFDEGAYSEIEGDVLDWKKNIEGKDVVVIENNESHIHDVGFGFIEYALKILESEMYD
ncbi:hypothetical protein HOF40_00070 [Candidatus Parcubacteria bacterium]|jgi:hypothetical protein|nr:hypothetical protein [Candidatus Parcubacteria bacterium]MBT3948466.1 hypothetical protein [Candidatus Parcubacteria bacterium]